MEKRTEFVEDWGGQSAEQRHKFYLDNASMYGKDLDASFEMVMRETG